MQFQSWLIPVSPLLFRQDLCVLETIDHSRDEARAKRARYCRASFPRKTEDLMSPTLGTEARKTFVTRTTKGGRSGGGIPLLPTMLVESMY